MSKRKWLGVGVLAAVILSAGGVLAGDLTPPGPPGATMKTLQEIYDKIDEIAGYVGGGDATAGDLLSGKKAWVGGAEVAGTMPNIGEMKIIPGTTSQTISQGYHDGAGGVAGDADLVTGNIRAGKNIFGVAGKTEVVDTTSGDAVAADMLAGKKAWVDGTEVTGALSTRTLSAGTTTVDAGYYAATTLNAVDADLIAGNIKKDVAIFGVTGTHEGGGIVYTNAMAAVPKTGQTTSYYDGDDGDLEKGVASPSPRFTDHGNGTVTDNLTGLMWVKAPHALSGNGSQTWNSAIDFCNNLTHGGQTDWRLPNVRELQSLIDYRRYMPALPSGHPFTGIGTVYFWSSSSYASNTAHAWTVLLDDGNVSLSGKTSTNYVWPVRGGQ